jgi:hypothetical protein
VRHCGVSNIDFGRRCGGGARKTEERKAAVLDKEKALLAELEQIKKEKAALGKKEPYIYHCVRR